VFIFLVTATHIVDVKKRHGGYPQRNSHTVAAKAYETP